MNNQICKNCGGSHGIHHYETGQCPVGGHEAALDRKQEWSFSTFQAEDNSAETIRDLAETIAKLQAEKIEILTKVYGFVNVAKINLTVNSVATFGTLNRLSDYLVSVTVDHAALAKGMLDG